MFARYVVQTYARTCVTQRAPRALLSLSGAAKGEGLVEHGGSMSSVIRVGCPDMVRLDEMRAGRAREDTHQDCREGECWSSCASWRMDTLRAALEQGRRFIGVR